jgi:hypothetical protein
MAVENKEREPSNKEMFTFFLILFTLVSMIYFFYDLATMWDDHRAEVTKKFQAGEEIICHEGTRAHRVTNSSGWEISGEYLEKGEFLLHMNGCKLENNTKEKR